ncbi:hypothetical protein DV738_g76, partial [Chaetothyriales sp. CBS 135597]
MPRQSPHPLAFFSLVPLNNRATAVLGHPENAHLVSSFTDKKNNNSVLYGLDIGPFIGSKSRYTLATIGRCGDVLVEGRGISRIHCSFELHEGNKTEVLLQDRSSNKSTKFFGETAVGFESGRAHRRVVVDESINLVLGLGGAACDLLQFRIVWHPRDKRATDLYFDYREDNPRQTRTIPDEPPTVAPSRPITRIHTPGIVVIMRYSKREKLGNGAFGEVWRVADVDTGNHLAVKRVQRPTLLSHEYVLLKREVETLSRISHRNIIEYISAQWADGYLDIIMEIKLGSVEDLIKADFFIKARTLAGPFLHQMLQALDYLASQSIVHRDVKPENILYSAAGDDGGYLYQLADFGLANLVDNARTAAGSSLYMAPELERNPQLLQTPKMDVWSLFVTLIYAMNAAGFREKMLHTTPLRIKAIQEAANEREFQPLQDMAKEDPSKRASAGDMLDKLYAGEGRSTRATAIAAEKAEPGAAREQLTEQCVEQDGTTGKKPSREPKASLFTMSATSSPLNQTTAEPVYYIQRVVLSQTTGRDHEGLVLVDSEALDQGKGMMVHVTGEVGLGMDFQVHKGYAFRSDRSYKSHELVGTIPRSKDREFLAVARSIKPPHDPEVLFGKRPPAEDCTTWGTKQQVLISGSVAGLVSRFVIAPLDVVKIRLQLQPHSLSDPLSCDGIKGPTYKGVFTSMRTIVRQEGLRSLWKGNIPAELMYLCYGGIQFASYRSLTQAQEQARRHIDITLPFRIPDSADSFFAGAGAGAIATTATYPMDLLRTRFAAQGTDKIYNGLVAACRDIVRDEGLRGFFRGLSAAVGSIVPYMGLFFSSYEVLHKAIGGATMPFGSGDAAAGVVASIVAKSATFPLDLIRKRLQIQGPTRHRYIHTNVPEYKGVFRGLFAIWRKEGVRGWYRGLTVSLVKAAPASAVTMYVYERTLHALMSADKTDEMWEIYASYEDDD